MRTSRMTAVVALLVLCSALAASPPGLAARRRPAPAPTVGPATALPFETVVVRGTVPGHFRRKVVLERKDGNRWKQVAAGRSDTRGKATFQRAAAAATYRLRAPATRHSGRRYAQFVTGGRRFRPATQRSTVLPEASSLQSAPRTSADGRYVVFASQDADLVAGDTNGAVDVFLRDAVTGTTTRVAPPGVQPNGASIYPDISADGKVVVFASDATNLVTGDTNARADIFSWHRLTGAVTLDSVSTDEVQSDGHSEFPDVSADGRYVTFDSRATNLDPGDPSVTASGFLRDTVAGTTTIAGVYPVGTSAADTHLTISRDGSVIGYDHGGGVAIWYPPTHSITTLAGRSPMVSGDGRYVVYAAFDPSSNLVVVRRDLGTDQIVVVSSSGPDTDYLAVDAPSVSDDGSVVSYLATTASHTSIVVRLLDAGRTLSASVGADGVELTHNAVSATLSGNGRYVGFHTNTGVDPVVGYVTDLRSPS